MYNIKLTIILVSERRNHIQGGVLEEYSSRKSKTCAYFKAEQQQGAKLHTDHPQKQFH